MDNDIVLTVEQVDLLELLAKKVITPEGNTYYYLPYWIRQVDDSNHHLYSFDNLPAELTEHLQEERDGTTKPILNYDGRSRFYIPYNDNRTPPEMKYKPED